LRKFKTQNRIKKITSAAESRQFTLRVVLENIHDPHNVSAIFRTCDAVGIPKVSLLYTSEEFPKISKVTSASAYKWVEKDSFNDAENCIKTFKNEGFKIYAAMLADNAINLYDMDFTEKVAIVMGNEHRGVSEETAKLSDKVFYIPMRGMIQSLNVSVATAVILYEAQRQRALKGMYNRDEMVDDEISKLIDKWCEK
jgi:tRNA (guanosine-2'-O-)-methyltransferase